jgi:RNA polymerase sigma-70 factor (ECF subfamily)
MVTRTGDARDDELAELRARLARAVARACPHWLADRRDEIVQNTLVRIWQNRPRDEDRGPLPTSYLMKAAYTATIDEIRRIRRDQARTASGNEAVRLDVPDRAPGGPHEAASAREIGRAIRECLAGLDRPRRVAVAMHLHGETLADAARLVGWTVKRMDNLVYRGLAQLRECLRGKGVTP